MWFGLAACRMLLLLLYAMRSLVPQQRELLLLQGPRRCKLLHDDA